jgi:hypothetical protein
MSNRSAVTAAAEWAARQFTPVRLGDVRRTRRVVHLAEAMARQPGGSIPQLFATTYEVKAAYTLLRRPEATPDALQAGHREMVQIEMRQPGVYLLLEDTSELSWSGQQPRAGLGPVGNGAKSAQGFLLHSVLAVRWPQEEGGAGAPRRRVVEVLGVGDQQYTVRVPRPRGEKPSDWWASHQRPRESHLWEQAGERLGLAPAEPGRRWVRVCDRGADIYEHLHTCRELGQGFVVRAAQDRALVSSSTGARRASLFAAVRQLRALGSCALELRARPGQPGRQATLLVSTTEVELRAPRRPGRNSKGTPPLSCTVIRVWEPQPPVGVPPLEWILLCDAVVTTLGQALECVQQYATRWLIEEYHKALKSGLGAERLQLETAPGLMAAIAVMSVVAVRLLVLREQLRRSPGASAAEVGLEPLELEVLQLKAARALTTVQEVALALGRLGGHLNRRGDGLPGWQTLWRGMLTLQTLVEGVRLGRQLSQFG